MRLIVIAVLALAALAGGATAWFLVGGDPSARTVRDQQEQVLRPPPENMQALMWRPEAQEQLYPGTQQSAISPIYQTDMARTYGHAVDYHYVFLLSQTAAERKDFGAVGRIDLEFANGERGSCTGMVISPTHVLTAGHCLYRSRKQWAGFTKAVLHLDLLRRGDPDMPLQLEIPQTEAEAVAPENREKWAVVYRGTQQSDLDYAVLPLKAGEWAKARAAGKEPVRLATPAILAKRELYIGHHPHGWEQVITAGPDCQIARLPEEDVSVRFKHMCDTEAGSSGAPVFMRGYRAVVGVHVCCDLVQPGETQGANYAVSIAAIAGDNEIVRRVVGTTPVLTETGKEIVSFGNTRAADAFSALENNNPRLAMFLSLEAYLYLPPNPDERADLLPFMGKPRSALAIALDRLRDSATIVHQRKIQNAFPTFDGKVVVTIDEDDAITAWDAGTGRSTFTIPGKARDPLPSFDHKRMFVANDDRIEIWDFDQKSKTGEIPAPDWFFQFTVSPDNSRVLFWGVEGYGSPSQGQPHLQITDASGRGKAEPAKLDGRVNDAIFSPSGSKVLYVLRSGVARVWDPASGKQSPEMQIGSDRIFDTYVFDNPQVAILATDKEVGVFDTVTGEKRIEKRCISFCEVFVSPDGAHLVVRSSGGIEVWNTRTGEPPFKPALDFDGSMANVIVFSELGSALYIADTLSGAILDLSGPKPAIRVKSRGASAASFSPDGKHVFALSLQGAIMFDAATGQLENIDDVRGVSCEASFAGIQPRLLCRGEREITIIQPFREQRTAFALNERSSSVAFLPPAGARVLAWTTRTAAIFDVAANRWVRSINRDSENEYAIYDERPLISPDGKQAIFWERNFIRIWNLETYQEKIFKADPEPGGTTPFERPTSSRSGQRVLLDNYKAVKVWDTQQNRLVFEKTFESGARAALSSDGTQLAVLLQTSATQEAVVVFSIESGAEIFRQEWAAPAYSPAYGVALSEDGTMVLAWRDKNLMSWTIATQEAKTQTTAPSAIQRAAFLPDGKRAYFWTRNQVGVMTLADGAAKLSLPHKADIQTVDVSPGGDLILSRDDRNARLWRMGDDAPLVLPHGNRIEHAAFSPDGTLLFTADRQNARVWETATGDEIVRHGFGPNSVLTGDLSPDGRRVLFTDGYNAMINPAPVAGIDYLAKAQALSASLSVLPSECGAYSKAAERPLIACSREFAQ